MLRDDVITKILELKEKLPVFLIIIFSTNKYKAKSLKKLSKNEVLNNEIILKTCENTLNQVR